MQIGDFERAKAACELIGSRFEEGNYLTGKPATIHAPRGVSPNSWDGKNECVARLFGRDGVSKAPDVNFMIRFDS
ncbi:MAG: hypothetical protein LH610_13095 [Sphingomonas bacterium]|nr:hypothetical protein [Sphingomonas bacterium]